MLTGCISVQFDPDRVVVSDFVVLKNETFTTWVAIDTPFNFFFKKNVETCAADR